MAQYRLSVAIASRAKGRSAVAMAAYRAAARLTDERLGHVHNFARRRGLVYAEIVTPAGMSAAWAHDRGRLWNRVEAAETRRNSQVAREIVVSLPHELAGAGRRDLAQAFAHHVADRYGIAVDLSIHAPGDGGSDLNHHAHLMLTTRRLDARSATGFGAKVRELDGIAQRQSGKAGAGEVEGLRQAWAGMLNAALAGEGFGPVDHRSYRRQGSAQVPTIKLGPAASRAQRRGEDSERGQWNTEISERNALRAEIQNLTAFVAEAEQTPGPQIIGHRRPRRLHPGRGF